MAIYKKVALDAFLSSEGMVMQHRVFPTYVVAKITSELNSDWAKASDADESDWQAAGWTGELK